MEQAGDRLKRVRLTGDRFAGGRLPIDSLVELERYQQAVRLMARHEWLRDNPDAPEPGEFSEAISLTIERIDEGSADVFLAFEQTAQYQVYQAQARDAVDATIAAAYGDLDIPELPEAVADDVRGVIASIGQSIDSDQTIEFYGDAGQPPVTVSIATRPAAVDKLLIADFLLSPAEGSRNDLLEKIESSVVGRVTAVNAETTRFELDVPGHGLLHGWYRENISLLDDLRAVLDSSQNGPLTRVTGDLQLKDGSLFRFWNVSRVERIEFDDTDWGRSLERFSAMRPGWAGGHGASPTFSALDAAQSLLHRLQGGLPDPAMAPTEDGGVLLEWIDSVGIRSVEVLPDGSFELFSMKANERAGSASESQSVEVAVEFVMGA